MSLEDFDRRQLLTFLRAVDRNLESDAAVVVVGGAALSVAYGVEKRTSDIDVIDLVRGLRIPLDPGGRSVVIRALVPIDPGTVGAKRRVKAHVVG